MPLATFAQSGNGCPADLNEDGVLSSLDIQLLESQYESGTISMEQLTYTLKLIHDGCDGTVSFILPTCGVDIDAEGFCDPSTSSFQTTPCSGTAMDGKFGIGGDIVGKCMVVTSDDEISMFVEENGVWQQLDLTIPYENAGSSTAPNTGFGEYGAIKITHDYLFVGTPLIDGGYVYIYKKNTDGTWPDTPSVTLTAPDGDNGDQFGISIDAKNGYLIVGAPNDDGDDVTLNQTNSGAAYLYKLIGDIWTFEKKWKAATPDESVPYNASLMGFSVALDLEEDGDLYAYAGAPQDMINAEGTLIACDTPGVNCFEPGLYINPEDIGSFVPHGAVYTLKRGTDSWPDNSATKVIRTFNTKSEFGFRVDARNGRLAVSSRKGLVDGVGRAGFAEVFVKSPEWNNYASSGSLTANAAMINDFAGSELQIVGNDAYGYYLAIGVINGRNENDIQTGRVDLYRNVSGTNNWTFHQHLQTGEDTPYSYFGGTMLRMDEERTGADCGIRCVVGAPLNNDGRVLTYRLDTEGNFQPEQE
jgi:hypothetical protein